MAADIHNKGEFTSIYAVNAAFPNGGTDGDYVIINGWAHYWNADRGTWSVNQQRDEYWDELLSSCGESLLAMKDKLDTEITSREQGHAALAAEIESAKVEVGESINVLGRSVAAVSDDLDGLAGRVGETEGVVEETVVRVDDAEHELRSGKGWSFVIALEGQAGTEEAYAVDIPAGNGFVLKTAVSGLDSVSGATLKFVTGFGMPYLIEEDFNPAGYERTFSMGYDVKGILVGFGNMDAGEMTLLVNQTSFAMDADLQSFRAQIYNVVTKDEYKALVANNQVVEERLYFVLEE